MPRFPEEARVIPDFLDRTVRIWPDREAYRWYDFATNEWISITWREFSKRVLRWRKAFAKMGLTKGDRVAMLLLNSLDAVTFDQAALANGLVTVPLHASDTAGSSRYILADSGSRFLVTVSLARWHSLVENDEDLPNLIRVVFTNDTDEGTSCGHIVYGGLEAWLATGNDVAELPEGPKASDLSSLVYTSGTTGRPKGVMMSHSNIVNNVRQMWNVTQITEDDVILSYLPLSHTFERTAGAYTGVAFGACLAFSRGVSQLRDDLADVRPTVMSSVPRIYERFYNHLMAMRAKMPAKKGYFFDWAREVGWRRFCRENDLPQEKSARRFIDSFMWPYLERKIAMSVRDVFGGRMRVMLSGGASLNSSVARFFCGMGLPLMQVYGLTETSPMISMCAKGSNHPATVGFPLSDTQVRTGENDELQVKGPQVMQGYFNREADTRAAFTEDGWFKTGDQADLSDGGRIRIKGRIKEILVTSTGEKISPVDLEFAIQEDPLFEQVMAVGENRPYVSVLTVLNKARWQALCAEMQLDPMDPATMGRRDVRTAVLKRIKTVTRDFPRYGQPRNVAILPEAWTIDNGLLTPTLKLRRKPIAERFASEIDALYSGHQAAAR